jgi:hypothetical protein
MPKRAIQILYNEIDLLRKSIDTYEPLFVEDRNKYEAAFNLPSLK